jgi:RNA polymerase sigma factor (TIGR02999 family)
VPVSESVTQLLIKWNEGDEEALARLTPLVYEELRRQAAAYLRQQRPGHTLQPTALVHEAYLQLFDMRGIDWQSRAHFVHAAAQAMRRILVDHARRHGARKRGGGAFRVPLSRAERVAEAPQDEVDLVELDEALREFAGRFPRQAKAVELHYFGGLSVKEIPSVLRDGGAEVSLTSVERDLRFARAWLHRRMTGAPE